MAHPNRDLELWNKLVGLPLDRLAEEPPAEFGFVKRLMRDEKWDYATAIRVVSEYRRFVFLAASAPSSPSPMVDAAWHLHLTYTRAYNTGLCERTLGRALDHTPSNGTEDTLHYRSVYADTLERYRETFGEAAPEDIWPPAELSSAARAAPASRSSAMPWLKALGTLALVAGFIWLFMRWPMVAGVGAIMTASVIQARNKKRRGEVSADFDGDGDGGGGDGCGGGCGGGCG